MGIFENGKEGQIEVVDGQMKVREKRESLEGLREEMKEDFKEREILKVMEGLDKEKKVEKMVGEMMEKRRDIEGI